MTTSQSGGRVNSVLLLIIGLLVGVIAGYMYGRTDTPQQAVTTGTTTNQFLNDRIAAENQWIVEGLNCPMPGCTNTLLDCGGDLPRQIRHWVNAQLSAGRSGQDIRDEIIRTHGDNLFKTFGRPGGGGADTGGVAGQ